LVLELHHLTCDLINLVVSREQYLTIIYKLHLNVIRSTMKELIEHVLEDLVLGSCQVDLSILLLDAKNLCLKLNLFNERLEQ
jgi:hypothetical protein